MPDEPLDPDEPLVPDEPDEPLVPELPASPLIPTAVGIYIIANSSPVVSLYVNPFSAKNTPVNV